MKGLAHIRDKPMKPNHRNPLLLPAITLAGLAFGASASFAADLTWDTLSGDGATVTAGSGSWNLTAGNTVWNNAGSNVIWSQTSTTDASNAAIFAGADGTLNQYVVTLGAQMAAESITFNSSGYQITGSTLALMPTTATSGAITVAAGKTATINSILRYAHNTTANVSVGSGGTLNLGGGTTATFNPQWQLSGAGTLNFTGGTFTNNIGNFNTAAINLTGGTHAITPGNSAAANIGNAAGQNVNYTVSGTGTLTVNNNASSGTGTGFSALRLGFGDTGVNEAKLTVQTGGTVTIGSGKYGELQISGSATSNGKLDVQGGTVTIAAGVPAANKIYFFKSGSNSGYTSAMTQSGGTVTANGIQFGGDTGTYDASSSATLTLSGGSLYVGAEGMTRGSAASTLPVTIQLQGGTLGASANWSSALDMKLGVATIQAATSGAAARNITLSGVLSNDGAANGSFTKTGAGTLFLNNDSNTFSGQVLSDSGILQVTKLANAGTPSSLGSGAAANVIRLGNNATATIEYVGSTDSSTNNSASGKLTFNGSNFNPAVTGVTVARTLTLGGSNTMDNTISGQIVDNGGVGGTISVVKQDAGKWILSGSNGYTGATSVTAGTLVVNGNISTSSLTTVSSGATLGGSGTVGALTVLAGGNLAPGNSPGTLNTGTVSLADTSVLAFELNPTDFTVGGNINDLINVTGNLTLDGILNVVATSGDFLSAAIGTKWRLFDYSGSLTDNVLSLGSIPSLGGGLEWDIDTATAGQVNLVIIPEPGAALLGGFGLIVLLRRRRH
jgi:fibronectin-binding autotransporter adhesin